MGELSLGVVGLKTLVDKKKSSIRPAGEFTQQNCWSKTDRDQFDHET